MHDNRLHNRVRAHMGIASLALASGDLPAADEGLDLATRGLLVLAAQGLPVSPLVDRLARLQDRWEAAQG